MTRRRSTLTKTEIESFIAAADPRRATWEANEPAFKTLAANRAIATGHGAELIGVQMSEAKLPTALRTAWWQYLTAMALQPRGSRKYRAARKGFQIIAEAATLGTPLPVVAKQIIEATKRAVHAEKSARRPEGAQQPDSVDGKIRQFIDSTKWKRAGQHGEIARLVAKLKVHVGLPLRRKVTRDRVRRILGIKE